MLKNYLKIAWRNLWKNKTYSFINLTGLITGITCCILMGLYIRHELSFDRFQKKGDRIVRVIMEYSHAGQESKQGNFTSARVFPVFAASFPEIESGVRMTDYNLVIRHNNKQYEERRVMFADSTFFQLFSFPILSGDARTALNGPNKIMLTAASARKYFGSQDPVGQTLQVGPSGTPYEVTGVLEDCPENSQIQYDFLASFSSLSQVKDWENTYWNADFTTYFLLHSADQTDKLQAEIPVFMKGELKDYHANINFHLEPFYSIHLHSPYDAWKPNTSITDIYIAATIVLLILSIACFTYINLSTARSMERAREVGIRKVSGALRKQIFYQFICESLSLCLLALLVSVGVVSMVLPAFNHLLSQKLLLSNLFTPAMAGYALLLVAVLGLLAGSYPALILSGFQPAKILKGAFKTSNSGLGLRKTLIVFQFAISIFLVIATLVVQKQLYFIQHKNLGYDRDHILVLPVDIKIFDQRATFRNRLMAQTDIKNVSVAATTPLYISSGYTFRSDTMSSAEEMSVTAVGIDEQFLPTNNIHLLYGENLSGRDIEDVITAGKDTTFQPEFKFLLNESAARALGWQPSQAVGKRMFLYDTRPGIVKGVVSDFHFSPLHNPVKPLVLFPTDWGKIMMVKVSGNHLPETISSIENIWKQLAPHRPFQYRFMDDDYNNMYITELRLGKIVNLFAGIAITLACIGLLGLSSYTVQQRSKEISVRKILGASVPGITGMLSKDFIKLVLISFVAAAPLAWLAMRHWLNTYAYRIDITWWIFALAAIATLLVTLLTVGSQAMKAAMQSPVKHLKND